MEKPAAPHATLVKFGYPDTVVGETAYWTVLLRPKQITLGSLVLACNETATAFSELSDAAAANLSSAVRGIEAMLGRFVHYERINYLMLMMVDPHVHFHVLPRYDGSRSFEDVTFTDVSWPGPPDLSAVTDLDERRFEELARRLRDGWAAKS